MKKWVGVFAAIAFLGCTKSTSSVFNGYINPKPPKEKPVESEAEVYDPRVDVLFVVDNSGSMMGHQRNMASNINLFINEFVKHSTLDYHMGVITTDNGRLRGFPAYVDKNTPNGPSVLASNLVVGTSGSATEAMFDPIYDALTEPLLHGSNDGFLRDGAHLAIIIISDAEDQSYHMNATSLMSFLVNLKGGINQKVLAYGAIVPTQTAYPNCPRDGWETPVETERFLSASVTAPDNIMELCAPNFGIKLAGLANSLVGNVAKVIVLKHVPEDGTIRVEYGTQILEENYKSGWSFDAWRNAVILGDDIVWTTQPSGTKVKVTYTPTHYTD